MSIEDLKSKAVRDGLAKQIKEDIDAYCVESMGGDHRHHLGASIIGHECSRRLWYIYRWVKLEKHDGRQLRLFNRGHLEEERFVEWLRGIGCTVSEFQEDGETQHKLSAVNGHFGSALDGMLTLPERYGNLPMFLSEFKTNNDSTFKKLKRQGVLVSKPAHIAQMSIYGKAYNFDYAVYMAINKNDDDLHIEVVELNIPLAEDMIRKAEDIIYSKTAPQKLSQDPTFYQCKWCHVKDICHGEEQVEINCRSCSLSSPTENAEWTCEKFGIIPKDFLKRGCDQHVPIV